MCAAIPTVESSPAPPQRDGALPRGAALGRYMVLGVVGTGAMGEVYAAYDPELDRKVALKLLRVRPGGDGDGRQRLMREAQAIAKLSHPNVVTVYDVGTFQEHVFIAMQFIDGHTLGHWIHAQPRAWSEIFNRLARFSLAREWAQRALAIFERTTSPDGLVLAYPLTALGVALLGDGQPATAMPFLERAVALRDVSEGKPSTRAESRFSLARALDAAGQDRQRAQALARQARAEHASDVGPASARQQAAIDAWLAR